jgi:hypothetical protein
MPSKSEDVHHTTNPSDFPPSGPVYKVYKRRFLGLAQLVLLNIVVSWDVCTPAAHLFPYLLAIYNKPAASRRDKSMVG